MLNSWEVLVYLSSNLSGNVSGRDGVSQVISPVGIVTGIVGIK